MKKKDVATEKVKKDTIKPFKHLDKEANFWNSHSVVDEINDNTLVSFHQANITHTITIRFEPKHLQILRNEALQRDIGQTTLARMWVLERLRKQL